MSHWTRWWVVWSDRRTYYRACRHRPLMSLLVRWSALGPLWVMCRRSSERKKSSIKLLSGQKYRFTSLRSLVSVRGKVLSLMDFRFPLLQIFPIDLLCYGGWWDGVDSLYAIRYYCYCHHYRSTILLRRIESSSKNQLSRWFLTLSPLGDWIIRPFLRVSICQFRLLHQK